MPGPSATCDRNPCIANGGAPIARPERDYLRRMSADGGTSHDLTRLTAGPTPPPLRNESAHRVRPDGKARLKAYRHGAKENATMVRPGLTCVAIAAPQRRCGYIDLPRGAHQRRSLVKLRGYSAARTKAHPTVRPTSDQDTCGPYIAQVGTHSPRALNLTTWRS